MLRKAPEPAPDKAFRAYNAIRSRKNKIFDTKKPTAEPITSWSQAGRRMQG
jgi:hypothetical protein